VFLGGAVVVVGEGVPNGLAPEVTPDVVEVVPVSSLGEEVNADGAEAFAHVGTAPRLVGRSADGCPAPEAEVDVEHWSAFAAEAVFPEPPFAGLLDLEPRPEPLRDTPGFEDANPTAERPAWITDRTGAGIPPVAAMATPPPKTIATRTDPFSARILGTACRVRMRQVRTEVRTSVRSAATTWSSAASSPVDAGNLATSIKLAARRRLRCALLAGILPPKSASTVASSKRSRGISTHDIAPAACCVTASGSIWRPGAGMPSAQARIVQGTSENALADCLAQVSHNPEKHRPGRSDGGLL
jgi:hypothetical protein